MLRSAAQRLLPLMMVLAFLAGTGRSALGLHECLHHLGHGSQSSPSGLVDAESSGNGPGGHPGHAGHGHDSPPEDVAHGLPGGDGGPHGHLPGPCTCFGSCACACAPSGPAAGALVAVDSPPPPLPFLEEDVDLVGARQTRWDRPPATAPPSTLRVTAST